MNLDELKILSELPSVATACGPVGACLRSLLPDHDFEEVPDGGLLEPLTMLWTGDPVIKKRPAAPVAQAQGGANRTLCHPLGKQKEK